MPFFSSVSLACTPIPPTFSAHITHFFLIFGDPSTFLKNYILASFVYAHVFAVLFWGIFVVLDLGTVRFLWLVGFLVLGTVELTFWDLK